MWIISWMIFLCPPPNIGSCSSLLILSRCVLRCGVLQEIRGGVRVVEFGSLRRMQIEGQLFPVFSLFVRRRCFVVQEGLVSCVVEQESVLFWFSENRVRIFSPIRFVGHINIRLSALFGHTGVICLFVRKFD